jgi:hypothetical protein
MKKRLLPSENIALSVKSAIAQNAVINFFRANRIEVYEETTQFDPEYPYLYWDGEDLHLCQTSDFDDKKVVDTVEEFLELFFSYYPSLQLNEEYTAYIDPKKEIVTIGSEEIPFEKIMELAKIVDNTKS